MCNRYFACLFIFSLVVPLESCQNCEILTLTNKEKEWTEYYKVGQVSYFQNEKGQIDTVEVKEVRNFYTPCNKIELSNFQYEVKDIAFIIKSSNAYNGNEGLLVYKASDFEPRIPFIYFGKIGPWEVKGINSLPSATDTVLLGKKLSQVYLYTEGINMQKYDSLAFFNSLIWDKEKGLVAYRTNNGDIFVRVR